jgi:hypothetical protein
MHGCHGAVIGAAAINASCCLVVQAGNIQRQTLHQKSGSPSDRIPAMLSKLFQKLLMAEDRLGGLGASASSSAICWFALAGDLKTAA